ncbi:MAG: hypothetical protein WD607_06555 [Candidatus Paceibacterota bacterium]
MELNIPDEINKCTVCNEELVASRRHCPTCQNDAGAPNVRASQKESNKRLLEERFQKSQDFAKENNCIEIFKKFKVAIDNESDVVISMPANVARGIFEDPRNLYANYEKLVGSNVRKPASLIDDQHRYAVSGKLFGSYANSIIYGVLSLTDKGLSTYGQVFCKLRAIAIQKRTSFLEKNSYKFVEEHEIRFGSKLPLGHISDWNDKSKLVLAKLAKYLKKDQNEKDWQDLLLNSDGMNREKDEFVEAHIFDGFDSKAISSIKLNATKNLKREERLDFEIAEANFKKL